MSITKTKYENYFHYMLWNVNVHSQCLSFIWQKYLCQYCDYYYFTVHYRLFTLVIIKVLSVNYTERFFYSYFFVTAMCFIYDISFSYITHVILFYAHTYFWSMFLFSIPQHRFVCFLTIALRLFQSRWINSKVSVYGGSFNAWFTDSFNFVF